MNELNFGKLDAVEKNDIELMEMALLEKFNKECDKDDPQEKSA